MNYADTVDIHISTSNGARALGQWWRASHEQLRLHAIIARVMKPALTPQNNSPDVNRIRSPLFVSVQWTSFPR